MVLESANFQAASVRKTSVALKLRTDASMRFEKSQDPVNTVRGLARAIELLAEVSPGIRLVGGVADRKADFKTPAPIELSVDWLSRKLGRPLAAARGSRDSRIARVRRAGNGSRAFLSHGAELARDQGHLDQRRSAGGSGADDRLRIHNAASAIDCRRCASGESGATVSSPRAKHGGRAGIHGSLQLLVRQRRDDRPFGFVRKSMCE